MVASFGLDRWPPTPTNWSPLGPAIRASIRSIRRSFVRARSACWSFVSGLPARGSSRTSTRVRGVSNGNKHSTPKHYLIGTTRLGLPWAASSGWSLMWLMCSVGADEVFVKWSLSDDGPGRAQDKMDLEGELRLGRAQTLGFAAIVVLGGLCPHAWCS